MAYYSFSDWPTIFLTFVGIEIKLTGANASEYSVQYRTHIENEGWAQGWVADGVMSGSEGKGLRLEGIEIKIIKNAADLTAYNEAVALADEAVEEDYTVASWTDLQTALNSHNVTDQSYQDYVNEATEEITAAYDVLVLIPKVSSVTAINATQVQVTFNTAVDVTDAIAANRVTIAGVTFNTPVAADLSADAKTLTLTTTTQIDVTDAAVIVNPIITKADAKLSTEKYKNFITYKDTVSPTVVSATSAISIVTATAADAVTVKFSEPVQTAAIAYVNGENVTVTQSTNKDELVLALTPAVKAGIVLNIELTNVKDTAGNTITPNPATISTTVQAANAVAPKIASISTNGLTLTVEFDKEISSTDVTKAYLSNNGLSVGNLINPSIDGKKVTFIVELGTAGQAAYVKDGKYSATLFVAEGFVVDVSGNKLAASNTAVSFIADEVAPTLISSEYKDGKLVLNFSEAVILDASAKITSAVTNAATGYVGTPVDVILDATAGTGNTTISNDGKTVTATIALAGNINADATYKVSYLKDTFKDAATNGVAAFTSNIIVPKQVTPEGKDTQAPIITLTQANGVGTALAANGFYTIKYDVADTAKDATEVASNLDFTTILDVNNYTFAGKALPTGTQISTDKSAASTTAEVTINIPTAAIAKTVDGYLTVTGIKDVKGNAVTAIETTTTKITLNDAVAPVITAATVNATTGTIVITTSEEVIALNTLNFIVKDGTTPVAGITTLGTGTDAGKLLFTPSNAALITGAADTITVTTVTSANSTTDVNGNELTFGTIITAV